VIRPRLVVIGGGVSGLAAAWSAVRAGPPNLEVIVLEAEDEIGGKARSRHRDGWILEEGPAAVMARSAELDALINDCGLSARVVPAAPTATRRFVYARGRLRRIVPHPVGLVRHGVLSARGALRLLVEPLVPRGRAHAQGFHDAGDPTADDESVWSFANRRFGREVADRLVRPMTLGIFAGDACQLSMAAAFPRMAAIERDGGSLLRAAIARRGNVARGRMISFVAGIQALPTAMAARGNFTVRTRARAAGLERNGSMWSVRVAGSPESVTADAVVLAGEPWAMAPLIEPYAPDAAAALSAVACPPIAVVSLGFAEEAFASVPNGFGALVQRREGYRMLGALWESSVFPNRCPAGHVLIRAMFGGAVDPAIGALSEADLATLAAHEVQRLHRITAPPVLTHVTRIARGIPQYELGHLSRVAQIERSVEALPNLAITGFGLRGVALPDAIQDGLRTGERVARALPAVAPLKKR
jgi:oxygen-dependent protoporphyrinogen oxidase